MEYSVYAFQHIISEIVPVSVKALIIAFIKYINILKSNKESSVYTFYFFITLIFPSILTVFLKEIFEIYLFKMI